MDPENVINFRHPHRDASDPTADAAKIMQNFLSQQSGLTLVEQLGVLEVVRFAILQEAYQHL